MLVFAFKKKIRIISIIEAKRDLIQLGPKSQIIDLHDVILRLFPSVSSSVVPGFWQQKVSEGFSLRIQRFSMKDSEESWTFEVSPEELVKFVTQFE